MLDTPNPRALLDELNDTYAELHTAFEDLFWRSEMGDRSVNKERTEAEAQKMRFLADLNNLSRIEAALKTATGKDHDDLEHWQRFFLRYQLPEAVAVLRQQITDAETSVSKFAAELKTGYHDPATGDFVETSRIDMRLTIETHENEAVRKACFEGVEAYGRSMAHHLVHLVGLRNQFAQALGYDDFYAYKLATNEGLCKDELFAVLDEVYEGTKFGFNNLLALEEAMPGLNKPWNRNYMLKGDVTAKKDPYLKIENMVGVWGKSFAAMSIGFRDGELVLDLLQRPGKYDNGFCHWPKLVQFKNGTRIPGSAGFTTVGNPNMVGSGERMALTLFHEGGHAAHLLNVENDQVCLNSEYPPMTFSWAEVHSTFLDTMQRDFEWLNRYAVNEAGEHFPLELHEEELRSTEVTRPLRMMAISLVAEFERKLYEADAGGGLTVALAIQLAADVTAKYTDFDGVSTYPLQVPHLLSFGSACNYHSYALARIVVAQWRAFFYERYEHLVDNPAVGPEMRRAWVHGSKYTLPEAVRMAVGENISPKAFIAEVSMSTEECLKLAKARATALATVPPHTAPVDLDGLVMIVHGEEHIADSSVSFEDMAETFRNWVLSQKEAAE